MLHALDKNVIYIRTLLRLLVYLVFQTLNCQHSRNVSCTLCQMALVIVTFY